MFQGFFKSETIPEDDQDHEKKVQPGRITVGLDLSNLYIGQSPRPTD
jgi:hypothetical protein